MDVPEKTKTIEADLLEVDVAFGGGERTSKAPANRAAGVTTCHSGAVLVGQFKVETGRKGGTSPKH